MNPAIYYSVHHWLDGPADTLQRVLALRAAGVHSVEIGSRAQPDPSAISAAYAAAPNVLLHNYFPPADPPFVFNLASSNLHVRAASIRLARAALRLSAEIEAPCYGVHGGFVTDAEAFDGISFTFPSATDAQRQRSESLFVDAIVDLSRVAAGYGVRLLVENNVCPERLRGRLLLQTPSEFVQLFKLLGDQSERTDILLDVGHLLVSSRTFGFDPLEFVSVHQDRIVALHLHSNDGVEDRHDPLRPGSQALEIASACRAARWVTVEANCRSTAEIATQLALVATRLSG